PALNGGPPFGTGSLNLTVGSPAEKAAFGNEVDFQGLSFALTAVGVSVFTVGENLTAPGALNNVPSIAIELNPHITGSPLTFTTAVFSPPNPTLTEVGSWTDYDATTTGLWGLTGDPLGGPCNLAGTLCTWDELQAALTAAGAAPTILSVAISK